MNEGMRTPVGTGSVLARIDRKKVERMYTARFTNMLYIQFLLITVLPS